MHLLEGQFLRRFKPHGEGYLFRDPGRGDVFFTEAERQELIAYRRRYWASPLLWGGYLLAGAIVPLLLWKGAGWDGAWALALIAAVMLVVTLAHTDHKPNEVAQTRPVAVPVPPGETQAHQPWKTAVIGVAWVLLLFGQALGPDISGLHRYFLLAGGACWLFVVVSKLRRLLRDRASRGGS